MVSSREPPLVVQGLDTASGDTAWTPLTTLTQTIAAGGSSTLTLGIRRADFGAGVEGTLVFSGQGIVRKLVAAA